MVISARKGEFETGFERGGQTREHAMLVKTAGVKHMVSLHCQIFRFFIQNRAKKTRFPSPQSHFRLLNQGRSLATGQFFF